MKIQKGHYVPKELITSEAVHEAVVKVFVAAGFKDERPHFGKVGNISEGDDGLGVYNGGGQPTIMWGIKGDSVDEPLTLQQLFTAENGLQWPTSAYRVLASSTCVWFDLSQLPPVVISGNYSGGAECRVLAIRQPNASTQAKTLTHSEEGLTHWHERGDLPPVGVECEMMHESGWIKCKPIGFDGESLVCKLHVPEGKGINIKFMPCYDCKFRPIRTEREKFIDDATAAAIIGDDKSVKLNPCITAAFERLFAAGFRGPKVEK